MSVETIELRRRIGQRFWVSFYFHVFLALVVSVIVILSHPSRTYAYDTVAECPDPTAITELSDQWVVFIRLDGECGILVYDSGGAILGDNKVTLDGKFALNNNGSNLAYRYEGVGDGYQNTGNYSVNRQFDTAFDVGDCTVAYSNYNLIADATGDISGATGSYTANDVICVADPLGPTSVVLTSSGSTFEVGDLIEFNVSFTNVDFSVRNIFFYEDVEEVDYVKVVDNFPLGITGEWNFTHPYSYAGNYVPYVQLGNQYCVTPTSSGCVLVDDSSPMITVNNPIDYSTYYTNTFNIEQTSNVLPNVPYEYEYIIDSQLCGLDSFSGAVLYLDSVYPGFTSSGYVLTSSVGTGSLTFRYPLPLELHIDPVYPRIVVECTPSGITKTVWLGGSITYGLPVTFWVVGTIPLPESWTAGGSSGTFTGSSGTGFGLWAEKHVYQKGEPVQFRWRFKTQNVIDSVAFYKDDLEDDFVLYDTADDIEQTHFHYGIVQYNFAGEYHPYVQIRYVGYDSGIPSTYRNVYLGGGEESDGIEVIRVTESFYGGIDTIQNTYGIFGILPSSIRIDFGTSIFWKPLEVIANATIQGLIWLASSVFTIITDSPVFSTMHDLIAPEEGATKVLPSTYFGYDFEMGDLGLDRQFTIDYPSPESNRWWMLIFLQASFALSIFWYVLNKIF